MSPPPIARVGVDENGLGPRLGPLVATACLVESSVSDEEAHARGARLGVLDSKESSGFGAMAHAEGLALAVAERMRGAAPETADDVLEALSIDPLEALRAPCPASARGACWGALPVPALGGSTEHGRAILRELEASGELRVAWARSAVLCVARFNDALDERGSKLDVDLELFERLLLEARGASARPLRATCGMVGGLRRYLPRLRRLDPSRATILEETRRRSAYRVEGIGEIDFVVDADAHLLPVSLASMIGKVVRELAMARHNAFYRAHDPSLPAVSGYHDPVTARFIEASALLRARLGVERRCFERRR